MEQIKMPDGVERWPLDKFVPFDRNPNTHSDKQVAALAASMIEFGFTNPILVAGGVMIAGHGRLKAAQLLGLKVAPLIKLDHLSPSQRKAYVMADNKLAEMAEWDDDITAELLKELAGEQFELGAIGFTEEELADIFDPIEEQKQERDAPGPPTDPVTRAGDLWLLGNHRLLCGDSADPLSVARLMGVQKADMLFTDPPYGVDYAGKNEFLNSWDDGDRVQKRISSDDDITGAVVLCEAVLTLWKPWLSDRSSYYFTLPANFILLRWLTVLTACGFTPRHCLVWSKNNHVLGRCDYNYRHEMVIYGWLKTHKFYGKGEHKTSVWDIARPHQSKLHPTMKPLELIQNAILNSTKRDQVVLDVFSGSGSTIMACELTRRHGRGVELDPAYVDVTILRWQEETGGEALLRVRGRGKPKPFAKVAKVRGKLYAS